MSLIKLFIRPRSVSVKELLDKDRNWKKGKQTKKLEDKERSKIRKFLLWIFN